ncbi:hypothetical protein HPB47_001251 [Ixodes persulcatus]|uniref:Uncharacterized protein n=1 Tax=Ixodes persulcatus TaxID=34615 RepID=A0AC60PPY2_IXOPE|nr:hypothetical protein HPB47_001251 [Ixodes persulcatus]
MRGAIKRLRCSVRLGYCATEAHSWARGGASASAAAMTLLLWNAQTAEARAAVAERAAAAAPARQRCSRLGGSEARALAYGSPCGGFESRPSRGMCSTLAVCGSTRGDHDVRVVAAAPTLLRRCSETPASAEELSSREGLGTGPIRFDNVTGKLSAPGHDRYRRVAPRRSRGAWSAPASLLRSAALYGRAPGASADSRLALASRPPTHEGDVLWEDSALAGQLLNSAT